MKLRREKTKDIIKEKRKRLTETPQNFRDLDLKSDLYREITVNENDYERMLKDICPQVLEDKKLSTVNLILPTEN